MKKSILFVLVSVFVIAMFSACADDSPASPGASCGIVIGDKLNNENGDWSEDYLVALDQVIASDTTVYKLGIKLGADSNYILAIYNNNAGQPGSVIAQTAARSGTTGWNEADLTSPVSLTAGSTYWLVAITDTVSITSNEDSGIVKYYSYLYSDAASLGMPGGLTGWNDNSGRIKVYATSCR
ncbi:MAG: hypothetical protein JXR81_10530 [Candidatus Goldbacteria bacterium]|nr:hypothetical protein [Candidatus Goldiibacteriota bacterium]